MSSRRRVYRYALGLALVAVSGNLQPSCAQAPKGVPPGSEELPRPRLTAPEPPPPVPSILDVEPKVSPIDLASSLRLAGVQNPEVLLARERVVEAMAVHQQAAALYLPTINAGTSFNSHAGPLQQSNGTILELNRGSLYAGAGAFAVGAGTVTIPGVVWAGNVSETIFGELVTRQVVRQREFASQAVRNDVLLRVAAGYMELLRAEGRRAIAIQNLVDAREVARLTAVWAAVGEERKADADRAATDLEERNAAFLQDEESVLVASARLAQLLDLDPSLRLHATDGWVVPAPIVPDPIPLPELLGLALMQRPELKERQAAIRAALLALQGAKLLPFAPNVIAGYSAGTFGGGSNLVSAGIVQANGTILQQPRFGDFGAREDFDAVVYWSLRNLGVGNLALIRLAQSNARASNLRWVQMLDQVRAEVAMAYARTHARYAQIEVGERAVRSGLKAFQEDLIRIKGRQGIPLEVLDSMRLLGRSRYAWLDAIVDYNRAQFELYVALGQPPASTLARALPTTLVPPPADANLPAPPR